VNKYQWKNGKIKIKIDYAQDVKILGFGGTDRTNASRGLNLNQSYSVGSIMSIDVSMGVTILIYPRDYRFNSYFEFSYAVIGNKYSWIEKFFVGPQGFTWYIVALSVASFMGFLILVTIIICIVKCCRKDPEVSTSAIAPSPR
jgi:hypothetical protein